MAWEVTCSTSARAKFTNLAHARHELVKDVAEAACGALPTTGRDQTLAGVRELLDVGGGAQSQRAAVRSDGRQGLLTLFRKTVVQ